MLDIKEDRVKTNISTRCSLYTLLKGYINYTYSTEKQVGINRR